VILRAAIWLEPLIATPRCCGRLAAPDAVRADGAQRAAVDVAREPARAFASAHTFDNTRSELMYIGLGTVLLILLIVVIFSMMRRGSRV
jgi:hypothetical protein